MPLEFKLEDESYYWVYVDGEPCPGDNGAILVPIKEIGHYLVKDLPVDCHIIPIEKITSRATYYCSPLPIEIAKNEEGEALAFFDIILDKEINEMNELSIKDFVNCAKKIVNRKIDLQEFDDEYYLSLSIVHDSNITVENFMELTVDYYNKIWTLYENQIDRMRLLHRIDNIHKLRDKDEKGRELEDVITEIFSKIEGFKIRNRLRTNTEEIDIVIRNESNDEFWKKISLFIIVECKNWSTQVGKNEYVLFEKKLKNRHKSCYLGFLISINGFKKTFSLESLRSSESNICIVPLDKKDIREIILDENINEKIKQYVENYIFK